MKDPKLLRKEMIPVADVLPLIVFTPRELSAESHPEAMKLVQGDRINVTSLKLQTFKSSGVRCKICGCKGEYFAKEKYANQPYFHLNLYAVKDSREVLMTKDHIVPIAKGGRDKLNNFQTLCYDCNQVKANKTRDQVKKKHLKDR